MCEKARLVRKEKGIVKVDNFFGSQLLAKLKLQLFTPLSKILDHLLMKQARNLLILCVIYPFVVETV